MSVSTIKSKIRFLIGDSSTTVKDIFTYDSSAIFSLSENNVISVTTVYRNSVVLDIGNYSFNSTTNKVTISSSLVAGDTIEIDYTCYQNYSNTELLEYIQASLVYLSVNNYGDFEYDSEDDAIYPDIITKEENLISIIASILIKPDNKSINLKDVSIRVPDDLPVSDKISKTIALYKKDTSGIFDLM